MSAGIEIERKFLVPVPPRNLDEYPAARIEQGYLAVTDELEVRVRRKGEQAYLAVKSTGALRRIEEELEIDVRRFRSLWPLTSGRRIVKTRHEVPYDEFTIEVDIFAGAFAGLVIAEVEFESEAASEAFTPPSWFGREVTRDPAYMNRALAVAPPPIG